MEIRFSEEREELRRTVRRFLEDKAPMVEVRRLMETDEGYDRDMWLLMAQQLGLQGLVIPERFGGGGYSFEELVVVFEEMGRSLLCAPFFSTVALATSALMSSNDESAMAKYLPGIATGETIATLAHNESANDFDHEKYTTSVKRDGERWLVTGTKSFVIDGASANLILVAAQGDLGLCLVAVEASAPGITVNPLSTLDMTRKQSEMSFSETPGLLVGLEGAAWPSLSRAFELAATAIAAEEVGGAQRVLELSVDYASNRIQYGRRIGSFQAIKHKCADMLVAVETSKSALSYASWAAAAGSDEIPIAASLAKAYCSEAYIRCAAQNIQIHGGIGFTWEHDAHLYFRRAKSSELLLGSPWYHRELLAQHVGI